MILAGFYSFLLDQVTLALTYLVRSVLWFSFCFSVAYALGWVQRLLWFILEQTATFLWNGTPVTIGSLEIDLIRGQIWATNVVIHTPKREEWQWESPLIARIGRVYVEHNWVSSFLTMVFKMACGQEQKHILEIYDVQISDVQGFIERKQHIFNFYLMDKLMDLPDPKEILDEEKDLRGKPTKNGGLSQQGQPLEASEISNDNQSEASADMNIAQDQVKAAFPAENNNPNRSHTQPTDAFLAEDADDEALMGSEEDDAMAHRQAQQLVDDMFSAVKSIGRKRQKKGGILDQGSIAAQIASKLKQFQGTKNKSEAMQEGVKVIRRVSQAVVKKTKDIKTVMPKVPDRRVPDFAPVYARVGRIIVQDAKVFTRSSDNGSTATTVGAASNVEDGNILPPVRGAKAGAGGQDRTRETPDSTAMSRHGLGSKWNKPIGISEIVLRPSELCPPNTLLDDDGLPAIYQPLDKILDVVLKRALVGLAKTNTTRFLQTALGELLEMEYSTIFGDNLNGGNQSVQPSNRRPKARPYQRSGTAPELT